MGILATEASSEREPLFSSVGGIDFTTTSSPKPPTTEASTTSPPSTGGTTYPVTIGGTTGGSSTSCPPGYVWKGDGCEPSNSEVGPVINQPGTCPPGTKQASNGECVPITTNGNCPSGQVWDAVDGRCRTVTPPVTGNSPPPGGCPSGTIWNGSACVARPPSTGTPLQGSGLLIDGDPANINNPNYNINDLYSQGYESATGTPPTIGPMAQAVGAPAPSGTGSLLLSNQPNIGTPGASASGSGYEAYTQQLDPNSLAGARTAALLGKDSPLAQRAKQEGMLTAAARGLQNSSIAAGTAFGALTDRITPLALSESEALTQQALANQASINAARQFTAGIDAQIEQLNAQLASTEEIAGAQLKSDERKLAAQLQSQEGMFATEQANQMAQFNANWTNQAATLKAEMDLQSQQFNIGQQNTINSLVMQMNADLNKQYLAGTQAMDLATIQGQFQQLISQNQVAAELFNSGMTAIGQAMANHEITPDRIASYVAVQQDLIASGLQLMADINNLNFEDFDVDLTGTAPTTGGQPYTPTGPWWERPNLP